MSILKKVQTAAASRSALAMKRSEIIFNALLVPLDYLMLLTAATAAYFLRLSPPVASLRPAVFTVDLPSERYFALAAIVALCWLAAFAAAGLYQMKTNRRRTEEFFQIITGSSLGVMGIIVYIFLSGELFNSRFIVLAGWIFAIVLVAIGRAIMRALQGHLAKRYGIGVHRMLIVGGDRISQALARELSTRTELGWRVVKHLPHPNIDEVRAASGNPGVDEVLLADPDWPRQQVLELVDFCEERRIGFRFVPNLFQTLTVNVTVDTLSGVPVVELKRTALDGWGRVAKRIADVAGGCLGVVLLFPLFVLIGILIKLDSAGPVLVKLKRISQGREFRLYKFRSMVKDAHALKPLLAGQNERRDGPLFKMRNDPRVTRVGRFLRRSRLDEFPQLLNVIRGEMSLIGPRPHEPEEVARYQKHHKKVLALKPGMTGFAQVSGSSNLPFEEEVKLDTFYVENWSLRLDAYILLKTALILFTDRSAC